MEDQYFIGPERLKSNIDEFVVIDIRPYQKYIAGHIPRSIWIWFWDFTRHKEGKPSSFKSEDEIARILGKYGISEKDRVVIVYDAMTIGLATYTLWLLEYMGQEKVQLLKGGIDEWIKRGYPIEKGIYNPQLSHHLEMPLYVF
jgi:thiosulfate/3-mercaptopyruvate sulfurtransferase